MPKKDFPQEITFTANEKIYANELQLIFDDYLENDKIKIVPPCLVKEFILSVTTENDTKKFKTVENFQRICKFDIKGIIKEIKLEIINSHGDDARFYGIRIL